MKGRKDGRREEYQLFSIMKFAGTFKFRLLVMPISFKYLKNIETDSSGNFIVYQEMRCYFLTAQRLDTESSMEAVIGFQMNKGKEDVYFAIRGSKTADDIDMRKEFKAKLISPSCFTMITIGLFASVNDVLTSLSHTIESSPTTKCRGRGVHISSRE
uniref:Uncharacterized protein n=1 Tax=Lactuca sativa TaxID=4236 RepID=A0A9R1V898_LACSA|nr:hypothetical protein LSAT_V11C600329350 [Lactuca sativa]